MVTFSSKFHRLIILHYSVQCKKWQGDEFDQGQILKIAALVLLLTTHFSV